MNPNIATFSRVPTITVLILLAFTPLVNANMVDFDDLMVGERVNPSNPFNGEVSIQTSVTMTDLSGNVLGSGEGCISDLYGSPGIYVTRLYPQPDMALDGIPLNTVKIDVGFLIPTVSFSVDVNSNYSSILHYCGFDAAGSAISGVLSFFSNHSLTYTRLDINAPEGGYLTGFFFSQRDQGGVEVVMDNLIYNPARVPEAAEISTVLLAIGFLAFFRLRQRQPVHADHRL